METNETTMRPLQGLRVLELCEEIAGPYCCMQLADAGADVIKVEPVNGDWTRSLGPKIKGESALFLALNRGKRGIVVDAGQEKGREIICRLMQKADVLVEACRPREAERMGFSYEQVQLFAPEIVYCSISPFGSTGPYKDRSASELELQALSGCFEYLGEPGEAPVRLGLDIAGITTGLYAFTGILTGVYYRRKTGLGQKIEISMFAAMMASSTIKLGSHSDPDFWGGFHLTGPFDHAEEGYKTKDKQLLWGLPVLPDKQKKSWVSFCKQVGLEGLLEDPYFLEKGPRVIGIGRDAQEYKPLFEAAFEDRTSEELQNIIEGLGGYAGVFKTYDEVLDEPQVQAVEMVKEVEHPVAGSIKLVGIPWKLEKTPGDIKSPAPTLGQHTDEILRELNYPSEEISALRRVKTII